MARWFFITNTVFIAFLICKSTISKLQVLLGMSFRGYIDFISTESPLDSMGAKHKREEEKYKKGEGQSKSKRNSKVKTGMQDAWQKVLYKQQTYPDNHTDGSILSDLVGCAGVFTTSSLRIGFRCGNLETVSFQASSFTHGCNWGFDSQELFDEIN